MADTELTTTFSVGETVVYSTIGLGRIIAFEARYGKEYLKIKAFDSDSVVLLPALNAAEMGLRRLSSRKEIESILGYLSDEAMDLSTDWKKRNIECQSLLKTGRLEDAVKVVNALYRRSKTKELPSQEKKNYDTALSMVVAEVSSVLDTDQRETERIVFSHLEKL